MKSRLVKVLVVLGSLAVPLAVVIAGFAYWTAPGSGSATQAVATLTAPSPTATSPTFGTAHIAWSAVTLDPAVPSTDTEVTYTVERKLSSGSIWSFVCGTGTTPKPYNVLSCDDAPPATATYDYRVSASLRSWTSPGVASVSVVVDTVPPTSVVTFPGTAVYSAASWNAGCSSSICGTAADTGGSGLQKVDVSIRQGAGSYWNGSAFASVSEVWNLVGGTTSWSYGFSSTSFPADGQYTVSSRATDNAANVQSPVTTRTLTIDTTPPSVTASTIAATVGTSPAGFAKQGAGYNVYADVTDANGIASVTANVSNVTTGQTAVALTACVTSCTVAGHTYLYKSALLTATNPLSEGSKSYTLAAVDLVSNASAPASFAVVIDNTAPSIATVIAATIGTSPTGFVKQAGTYRVYANVTDLPAGAGAASGVNASSITANVSTVTTGSTAVSLTACGGCGPASAYAYQTAQLTASNPLSEGSKAYTVSASDNLATSGSSSGATVQVDNTAPSVSTVIAATIGTSPTGFVKQAGTYRVYANVTDLPAGAGAASGVNASSITANVSTVTTGLTAVALTACGSCGPGSAYAYQTAQLTASNPLSEGSKAYTVSASDNLATSGSSSGATVRADNTAPSVATVLANTATNEGGWLAQAGTYRVYANVTDLPAGAGAASGVNASSITTNVSAVTAGQTAVALTTSGCPCTINGTSYAYQTALLTADNPLSAGSKSFTTSASDNLASTTAQGGSVTVDNTAPVLSTLQMFDTDTDGRVDQVRATFGETLYTYSAGTTPWTLASAPGGASNTLASVSVATTVATLTLNEGTVNTASGSFTVALAQNAAGIRDFAGNRSLFAATTVADRAAPVPTNVVMTNVRNPGWARRDDTLTVTYSEALDATSFCSTWANGSTQTITGNNVVDVLIADNGANDVLSIADVGSNCGGGANFRFGSVALGANYVDANTTFAGNNMNQGILTWNPTARTLTITLGGGNGSETGVGVSTPIYTPNALLDDLATPGNTIVATAFSAPATSQF